MLWALALQLRRDVLATRTQSVQELTYLIDECTGSVSRQCGQKCLAEYSCRAVGDRVDGTVSLRAKMDLFNKWYGEPINHHWVRG